MSTPYKTPDVPREAVGHYFTVQAPNGFSHGTLRLRAIDWRDDGYALYFDTGGVGELAVVDDGWTLTPSPEIDGTADILVTLTSDRADRRAVDAAWLHIEVDPETGDVRVLKNRRGSAAGKRWLHALAEEVDQ